jgi:DNA-binding transcriptional ArsR family regulator
MNAYRDRAQLLKCIAHPVRLQILDHLRRADECVCHLTTVLARPQPYVSQQLAVLRNAGLIRDRKDGTHVFYELVGQEKGSTISALLDMILPVPPGTTQGHERIAGCCCPRCTGTDCPREGA